VAIKAARGTAVPAVSFWPLRPLVIRWSMRVGAAAVVIGLAIAVWKYHEASDTKPQDTAMLKYFSELEALFPDQLRAVIFDNYGPRLMLSEQGNVPRSTPVYLKVCAAKRCQKVVTFSGQQVPINGDTYEVLTDAKGNLLLVGDNGVWSSAQPDSTSLPYVIEGRLLRPVL